jgi:mannitol/fructose-specific phosphotransferase system IIA component
MCRDDADMRNVGVRIGVGHELRPFRGKERYVVLDGHPCKIRHATQSAQNLLRITAVGLFDEKRRDATFGSVEKVFIPTVEARSNILATFSGKGFAVPRLADSMGLPKTLSWRDDETKPEAGQQVLLTVLTACGYAKAIEFQAISDEKARGLLKMGIAGMLAGSASAASFSSSSSLMASLLSQDQDNTSPTSVTTILSKKEQRKLKKQLKKVGAVHD